MDAPWRPASVLARAPSAFRESEIMERGVGCAPCACSVVCDDEVAPTDRLAVFRLTGLTHVCCVQERTLLASLKAKTTIEQTSSMSKGAPSAVPSKARQPNPQEVSDVRTRFNKDLEQLRERVKEDSATVKQKLTWRNMLEEPPATGYKRLAETKAIDLEGAQAAPSNSQVRGVLWIQSAAA